MPASLDRNIRLFPWYILTFKAYFWLPVFFIYFNSLFSIKNVLLLEAIYFAAVVLLEVPSGYFSDAAGRRKTLLIASIFIVLAHGLFFFGTSFTVFAIAQVCLAVGMAFNSGTDTSLHYESLAGLGKQSEFAYREARVARNTFVAGAVAALVGGGIAVFQLRLAYGLSFLSGLVSLALAAAMIEPTSGERKESLGTGAVHQILLCVGLLRRPAIMWLVSFSVLMVVLNHVPYEFYQPYIEVQSAILELPASLTPVTTGVITSFTMLLASLIAARSIRLRDRFGLARVLLFSIILQTAIILAMGVVSHAVVIVLILFRSCPRAMITAPLNATLAPQIPQGQRATFFSLQSLAGRLSFSGLLVLLSLSMVSEDELQYESLSQFLLICAMIGFLGFILFGITSGVLAKKGEPIPRRKDKS